MSPSEKYFFSCSRPFDSQKCVIESPMKGDNAKWMPDHCHPNLAGYTEIWMPAVLPYFKEICGK